MASVLGLQRVREQRYIQGSTACSVSSRTCARLCANHWAAILCRRFEPQSMGIVLQPCSTLLVSLSCPPARAWSSGSLHPAPSVVVGCLVECQCSRVCMCRKGCPHKAFALADRFTSDTSPTAHRSRSEASASAREAKSEQSVAGQACNKPVTTSSPYTHATVFVPCRSAQPHT